MRTRNRPPFNRRDFLKLGGALAAASLASACTPQERSSETQGSTDGFTSVTQPSIENLPASLAVIALNRMAFGPRPGDIEAFNALGDTDEERLRAYVEQQLNPDSIDDSDFEARYEAAGFETLHKTQQE